MRNITVKINFAENQTAFRSKKWYLTLVVKGKDSQYYRELIIMNSIITRSYLDIIKCSDLDAISKHVHKPVLLEMDLLLEDTKTGICP